MQVDLLISFCLDMGLGSVILVGHDDGGLLALRTAEKLRASGDSRKVQYCDFSSSIVNQQLIIIFGWKFVVVVMIILN